MRYDIIGDVHGEAQRLVGLLSKLGYRCNPSAGGAWTHPERQAVFVGDLIDRGPGQLETVRLVRSMIDAGSAHMVLGNHEINAITFALEDPERPGYFLLERSGPAGIYHRKVHRAFLDAVKEDSALHMEMVSWFSTLPLFLELPGADGQPGIRVAHACWDQVAIDSLRADGVLTMGNSIRPERMASALMPGLSGRKAVDALTIGPGIRLPEGHFWVDRAGKERRLARARWWDSAATLWSNTAVLPHGLRLDVPDSFACVYERPVFDDAIPTFFGHYWMRGAPERLAPSLACLDYSVASGGELVAYRWDGEVELDNAKFVTGPSASRLRALGLREAVSQVASAAEALTT